MIALCAITGCEERNEETKKKPRPVQVEVLRSLPGNLAHSDSAFAVTASVASWKTEEIGFEVSGRIISVVEPNTDIETEVLNADGSKKIEATPIATIDDEKYRLQYESAEAQVKRSTEMIRAAKIEIEKSLEAQLRAAEAERKLARTEYERSKRLFEKKAGAEADVDRDEARYESAVSTIEQLNSTISAKKADLESLKLQLQQDEKASRDAQRNVDDCILYSSFPGQISEVSVVPGSFVTAGKPIVTLQMMDPIKIELEVSAEKSRNLRNRQRLPVFVTNETGEIEEHDGFLYLIDPVADPQTRTFTITLLVVNKRIEFKATPNEQIATTHQTWRLDLPFIPGVEEGKLYVGEEAILSDSEGEFLWRIDNVNMHEPIPKDRILKVSKLRVKAKETRLPFLGNWIFQEVEVEDPEFDPTQHMVAAKLRVSKGDPNDWDGDEVIFQEAGQWMLRPGDLVKVDLADDDVANGLFIPMEAIAYEGNKFFVFLLDETQTPNVVRKTEITRRPLDPNSSAVSSLQRVTPVDPSIELEGKKYITRGAHYLRDGEKVKVVVGEGSTK